MTKNDVYENVPTVIDGVELRVTIGARPNVPVEVVQLFLDVALKFMRNKQEISLRNTDNKVLREKIIQYVESIPGFRGIRSGPDDFRLLAVQKEKVTWDQKLLKASLGVAYQALVAEEFVATVTIPPGIISEEKLREGLERLLKEIGVPLADIPKLLKTDTRLSIDTEKLDEIVEAKRAELLPGTKLVEVEWAIDTEPLKSPQTVKKEKKSKV